MRIRPVVLSIGLQTHKNSNRRDRGETLSGHSFFSATFAGRLGVHGGEKLLVSLSRTRAYQQFRRTKLTNKSSGYNRLPTCYSQLALVFVAPANGWQHKKKISGGCCAPVENSPISAPR